MPNAADRKSIRQQEKSARLAGVRQREVVTQVMSTEAGRHFMWDYLASAALFHTTFNGDALQSAFAEGRRSLGLELLAIIMTHCPDQYIQAQRESHERSILADTIERRDSGDPAALGSGPVDPAEGPAGESAGAEADIGADIYTDPDPGTEAR